MTREHDILQSATTLVEATLRLDILESHKRDVINVMLWKITESTGKYTTRYRSKAALTAAEGIKLQHEHVIPRKSIIDAIMREPARARELLSMASACVVTHEVHQRLNRITRGQPHLTGWGRYTAAGIIAIDTEND